MERYILTLLVFVMCLLGSKTQAMNLNYDGSTSTITLDKGEYLYQQVEKKDILKEDDTTDYAHFSLSNANGKLKSIALPSNMDVIGDNFDFY